ncbi:MAG: DUF5658 family protein [Cellulosilyticaceae bacterium]
MKTKTITHTALGNKLTLIYCLNSFDILFTFILLKTGMFFEANHLMRQIVESAPLSILVKLLAPAILIIYILLRLEELPPNSLRFCNLAINLVLGVYIIINILHVIYTNLFIFQII